MVEDGFAVGCVSEGEGVRCGHADGSQSRDVIQHQSASKHGRGTARKPTYSLSMAGETADGH